ncbi:MAG: U5 small nuclear ribonucleoprotein, partial [Paramarteilia canceri]
SSGNILYSCSDDKTIKKWDLRAKSPVATHQHTFEVTTICALSEDAVFFGGLDNQIYCWDSELAHIDYEISNQMRPNSHSEMIYSTALSPTKRYMLSVSADKSMKVWNVQPFLSKSLEQQGRCMAQFYSQFNSSDFDIFRASWSCDEKYVSCGGAKLLFIWNFQNKKLEYALPGHLGNVTCVDFSPNDPSVVLSAGTDGIIFVGELENN